MGEEWSRPILIVKNDRKIEPLNMPDFNKWVADPPRGWPLKILVYERNKFPFYYSSVGFGQSLCKLGTTFDYRNNSEFSFDSPVAFRRRYSVFTGGEETSFDPSTNLASPICGPGEEKRRALYTSSC